MKKTILSSIAIAMIAGTMANAEEATYENVTALYSATFNRAPDADGLKYWVDTKMELEDIATSFFDQPETQDLYPDAGTDNAQFVQATYQNLFNRDPDDAGMDYWTQELEAGNISQSAFILAVVNGATGDDELIMENKTQVGLDFVKAGENDTEKAKDAMKDITADRATVEDAWKVFDYTPSQAELDHVHGDAPLEDGMSFDDMILGEEFHNQVNTHNPMDNFTDTETEVTDTATDTETEVTDTATDTDTETEATDTATDTETEATDTATDSETEATDTATDSETEATDTATDSETEATDTATADSTIQ
jgi:hypothetical protein